MNKPSAVRLLAAIAGLSIALLGYNLIFSPRETINRVDQSVTAWMLDVSRRDIALPIDITERNIMNSSHWGGFGDSEVIIQIKCDPVTTRKYRERCIKEFSIVEKREEVPNQFRNIDYGIWYNHSVAPSVDYTILFSESDDSSILVRRIKS